MYVDLHDLFAEHSRFLKVGGRYVTITGCWNPRYGQPSKWVSQINAHFECNIHSRREYLRAMADNRLVPQTIVDLTPDTLPYWALRGHVLVGHRDRGGVHRVLPGRLLPVRPDRRRPRVGPASWGRGAHTRPRPRDPGMTNDPVEKALSEETAHCYVRGGP